MKTTPKAGDVLTIEGFILLDQFCGVSFCGCELQQHGYTTIGAHAFTYAVPADYNPVAAEVAAIDKKLDQMADEYHGKVKQLNQRKQELLCIELSPS